MIGKFVGKRMARSKLKKGIIQLKEKLKNELSHS